MVGAIGYGRVPSQQRSVVAVGWFVMLFTLHHFIQPTLAACMVYTTNTTLTMNDTNSNNGGNGTSWAICSGNGLCSTNNECECYHGFTGDYCDIQWSSYSTPYTILCSICFTCELAMIIIATKRLTTAMRLHCLLTRSHAYSGAMAHIMNNNNTAGGGIGQLHASPPLGPTTAGAGPQLLHQYGSSNVLQLGTVTPATNNGGGWPTLTTTGQHTGGAATAAAVGIGTNDSNPTVNDAYASSGLGTIRGAQVPALQPQVSSPVTHNSMPPPTTRVLSTATPATLRMRLRGLHAQLLAICMAWISTIFGAAYCVDPMAIASYYNDAESRIMWLMVQLFAGLACGLTLRIFISIQAIFHPPSRRVLTMAHILTAVYGISYLMLLILTSMMALQYYITSDSVILTMVDLICDMVSFVFIVAITIGWTVYTWAISKSVAAANQRRNVNGVSEQQANAVALVKVTRGVGVLLVSYVILAVALSQLDKSTASVQMTQSFFPLLWMIALQCGILLVVARRNNTIVPTGRGGTPVIGMSFGRKPSEIRIVTRAPMMGGAVGGHGNGGNGNNGQHEYSTSRPLIPASPGDVGTGDMIGSPTVVSPPAGVNGGGHTGWTANNSNSSHTRTLHGQHSTAANGGNGGVQSSPYAALRVLSMTGLPSQQQLLAPQASNDGVSPNDDGYRRPGNNSNNGSTANTPHHGGQHRRVGSTTRYTFNRHTNGNMPLPIPVPVVAVSVPVATIPVLTIPPSTSHSISTSASSSVPTLNTVVTTTTTTTTTTSSSGSVNGPTITTNTTTTTTPSSPNLRPTTSGGTGTIGHGSHGGNRGSISATATGSNALTSGMTASNTGYLSPRTPPSGPLATPPGAYATSPQGFHTTPTRTNTANGGHGNNRRQTSISQNGNGGSGQYDVPPMPPLPPSANATTPIGTSAAANNGNTSPRHVTGPPPLLLRASISQQHANSAMAAFAAAAAANGGSGGSTHGSNSIDSNMGGGGMTHPNVNTSFHSTNGGNNNNNGYHIGIVSTKSSAGATMTLLSPSTMQALSLIGDNEAVVRINLPVTGTNTTNGNGSHHGTAVSSPAVSPRVVAGHQRGGRSGNSTARGDHNRGSLVYRLQAPLPLIMVPQLGTPESDVE